MNEEIDVLKLLVALAYIAKLPIDRNPMKTL